MKAGQLLALVGASGAGKTTLLSALSNRAPPNMAIHGEVLIGGRPPADATYRKTGFVAQLDLTDEQQTVREALEFSALLRQDRDVPRADKLAVVDDILDMLALDHLQDAIVGTPSAGLGLEERKRLSIGVELAAKPHCLFLDEPTRCVHRWCDASDSAQRSRLAERPADRHAHAASGAVRSGCLRDHPSAGALSVACSG